MDLETDLHIHTLVSDGEVGPLEMLEAAVENHLHFVSITDHDALGAYRHFHPDLFAWAHEQDLELIAGIELDTEYAGKEVHLLGYGFALNDGPLNTHLAHTQALRRQKVLAQLDIVNRHYGRTVIDPQQIILPRRETLMKPHLVHALMQQELFAEYRAAAVWLSEHARVPIEVPKLPIVEAIRLIAKAGGYTVLAHPGFLVREAGIDLLRMLPELLAAGLTGLEVEYPYGGAGPAFPTPESEQEMIREAQRAANHFGLLTTCGSDAHTPDRVGTIPLS
jgi:3',5'-nucleoside bisphosphate phosphatase